MSTLTSPDGTTLAYETIGSGPAVILVDGALCFRDAGPMRPIAEALAPHFSVTLYDRRGRGASTDETAIDGEIDPVAREIEDLDALVEAAGGSAVALGISSGAALLLRTADRLGPDRLTRIALYEPPYMPEPAIPAAAQYTAELTALLAEGRREDAVDLFLARVGVPEAGLKGMHRSPTWPATVALAPTLAYDDAALGDSRVPVGLAERIRIPLLGLAGGATPPFLRHGAEGVAAAAPAGRFELVEGQTHDIAAAALEPHLRAFFTAEV
ncbi:alpha/beta fold hydrolase [Herbiconiux solani]|uniref:alpha/beta fold hydrolase n=1 Tax=Herbiconiux solani TaxID=661329 RepID=UPI000826EE73|nr:alpha/beta fold hydrolase [Herbiconiux solani]